MTAEEQARKDALRLTLQKIVDVLDPDDMRLDFDAAVNMLISTDPATAEIKRLKADLAGCQQMQSEAHARSYGNACEKYDCRRLLAEAKEALLEIDAAVAWETTSLGRSYQDKLERLIKRLEQSDGK